MPTSEKKKQADRARYQANPKKKITQVILNRQQRQELQSIAMPDKGQNLALVQGGVTSAKSRGRSSRTVKADPAAEASAAEASAAETSVTETSATETSATETSATETSATETSATETLAAETPAAETRVAETRVAETRVAETRVAETRVAETRVAETRVAETRVAETRVAETRVAETRVAETRVAETRVAETSATETPAAETAKPPKKPVTMLQSLKPKWKHKGFACFVGIRLLFVVLLAFLQAMLQIEFYAVHDILPGYRVALAFACELSLVSLPSMMTSKGLAIIRWITWSFLFSYVVASQGYHAYSGLRARAQHLEEKAPNTTDSVLRDRLKDEKDSRARYERAGAWKLVEASRAKIDRLESLDDVPRARNTFGISDENLAKIGAWLIVFVRALLPIVSALNIVKIRSDLQTIA